jgi:hypothetical protein
MTGTAGGEFVRTPGPRQPARPNPDPASRSANHRLDPIKVATIRCRSIPRVVANVATSLARSRTRPGDNTQDHHVVLQRRRLA